MEQAFRTAKRERHCQKRKSCANMTIKTSVIWECPPISAADQAGRAKSVDFAERIIDFISLTNNLVHRVPLQGCPVHQPPRIPMAPKKQHRTQLIGWLRASVLGANEGVMSTASLLLGVAAAHTAHSGIMIAGVSGLVAGALAMAAGEYVSVSSQTDTEQADLALERKGLDARKRSNMKNS